MLPHTCCCSVTQSCLTLCDPTPGAAHQASLSFTISGVCSNSCPLSWWCYRSISFSVTYFSTCLQSFPASEFSSNELAFHIRWSKYWSFSFSISPFNEYSGLISFRIDRFDLLAVQGTLKSSPAPQFKNINSVGSAFFMVQLSHPYMTTGKTIALTIWTFVGKVMSLLLNILSRFATAFLAKIKHLLISWQQWFWSPRK